MLFVSLNYSELDVIYHFLANRLCQLSTTICFELTVIILKIHIYQLVPQMDQRWCGDELNISVTQILINFVVSLIFLDQIVYG